MEHVNHPKHYNSHPKGIECIDIIRHYTCDIANAIKYLWRAGLKTEMGKENADKEVEDLKKALWFIEDYKKTVSTQTKNRTAYIPESTIANIIQTALGYDSYDIYHSFKNPVDVAMGLLLTLGIEFNGNVYISRHWEYNIEQAIQEIQQRILDIESQLLDKEFDSLNKVMDAFMTGHPLEAVDGEDYISKPGCVRDTEPEHYDPLNMIVAFGRAYSLTDEVRKKKSGALYTPCENCDLRNECNYNPCDEKHCLRLCNIFQAESNEYFKEVGTVKYSPSFGTIEVVDSMKELEIEIQKFD